MVTKRWFCLVLVVIAFSAANSAEPRAFAQTRPVVVVNVEEGMRVSTSGQDRAKLALVVFSTPIASPAESMRSGAMGLPYSVFVGEAACTKAGHTSEEVVWVCPGDGVFEGQAMWWSPRSVSEVRRRSVPSEREAAVDAGRTFVLKPQQAVERRQVRDYMATIDLAQRLLLQEGNGD